MLTISLSLSWSVQRYSIQAVSTSETKASKHAKSLLWVFHDCVAKFAYYSYPVFDFHTVEAKEVESWNHGHWRLYCLTASTFSQLLIQQVLPLQVAHVNSLGRPFFSSDIRCFLFLPIAS